MKSHYNLSAHQSVTAEDMEKVKSTLRQFVRDWSEDGLSERNNCYKPILDELVSRFPDGSRRASIRVVCPGSGLGRLPFEAARLGFASQGNEFSYYMLIGSNFVLNWSKTKNQCKFYPYIHQTSNVKCKEDQLRSVSIPDIVPADELTKRNEFSMCAGDFLEVYRNQVSQWDCVLTCFFFWILRRI